MTGGQIILAEGSGALSSSKWSVFTVGELCSNRRAFVFKLGGRCDKVAVGFCFSGSGQEEVLMKRLQVIFWGTHCKSNPVRCLLRAQLLGITCLSPIAFLLHRVNAFTYVICTV